MNIEKYEKEKVSTLYQIESKQNHLPSPEGKVYLGFDGFNRHGWKLIVGFCLDVPRRGGEGGLDFAPERETNSLA